MKEQYEKLTQYEKKHTWKNRFGSLYRLYIGKLINRLFKDGKTWIFNIILLLPIVAGPIVAFAVDYINADDYYSLYSDIMFMGYFGIIIPLFTMYIASMMFSDEIGDKSITYLTVRPINRFELVIVKYLSYLSIVPLFTVIVTFVNYISFGVFGEFGNYFDMALWFLLAAFISSAVYGAFFMLIGLLFKNPLWFGLFYVFIWEFVLASFSQTLNNLTIAFYLKSLIIFDFSGSGSPVVFFGNQAHLFSLSGSPATAVTFAVVLPILILVSLTLAWAILQGDRFRIPYKAGTRPGGWKYYLKEIRSYLITFSVLFITIGIVFGPINGITKPSTSLQSGYIGMSHDYRYEPEPTPPDINEMGWGFAHPYTLSKGDDLSLFYSFSSGVYGSSIYTFEGIVCSEAVYEEFYLATQQRWLLYYSQMRNISIAAYYIDLTNDYFDLVDDLVADSVDSITFNSDTTNPIEIVADEKTDYMFMVVVRHYLVTDLFDEIETNIDTIIQGEVYRRAGYSLGFILLGAGVFSLGFSIYSLTTYSSEVEIKRYQEQIAKYEGHDNNNVSEAIEQDV
ncbi:MAG: ABC transporter permease [Asgard group archaeon]|nr:ABC transporter permease [Asgard group archaeon]